ncbi:MAG TPA: hypothetical protein VFY10_01690 [Dehalococcoidia bacterium]|nr:hypothetical protein [Dehalococcoidia bacterium]
MPDQTQEEVAAQLAALGLQPVDREDIEEITHRINAMHEALFELEPPGLDSLEPVTIFGAGEAQS